MTRKDFELLADAIASCEVTANRNGDDPGSLDRVVKRIGNAIATEHPRFNRGTFEARSLPLKHAAIRDGILAKFERES